MCVHTYGLIGLVLMYTLVRDPLAKVRAQLAQVVVPPMRRGLGEAGGEERRGRGAEVGPHRRIRYARDNKPYDTVR